VPYVRTPMRVGSANSTSRSEKPPAFIALLRAPPRISQH